MAKFIDKKEHVELFLRGDIHVKRLASSKNNAINDGPGRHDSVEGIASFMQPHSSRVVLNNTEITQDLAEPFFVQPHWLDHLHILCLHAGYNQTSDLLNNPSVGDFRSTLRIDPKCFRLGEHCVLITDVPEFLRRINDATVRAGCRICYKRVDYYNPLLFHGNFTGVDAAFRKQIQCQYQREFRIVIDSNTIGTNSFTLRIGDVKDITIAVESREINRIISEAEIRILHNF